MPEFTVNSVGSGIAGLDRAFEMAGFRVLTMVEPDAFCCKVLRRHYPAAHVVNKKIEDVEELSYADGFISGVPCQPYSDAGEKRGFADERNIWPQTLRIIQQSQPRFVIVENVRGSITGSDNLTDYILNDLEALDYTGSAFVIPALVFGAPHERYRVFTVAYAKRQRLPRPAAGNATRNTKRQYSSRQQRGQAVIHAPLASGQISRRHHQPDKHNMARAAHGAAHRLDFPGFPAGQGTYQHPWEPPRTVETKAPHHKERVQALGNAVVPAQAYPLAKAIHDWLVSTTLVREPMEETRNA